MGVDLARETAEVSMDLFGEEIQFAGEDTRGIPSTELVDINGMVERRMTVSVMVDEVPEIQSGQPVFVRGKNYQVDRLMDGREDPNVLAKVVLR